MPVQETVYSLAYVYSLALELADYVEQTQMAFAGPL